VHDFAELRGNQAVQFSDARVQHGRQVVRHHHGALHDFTGEFADQIFGAVVFGGGFGHPALFHNLVEQARIGLGGLSGRVLRGGGITHGCLPCRSCRLHWSVAAIFQCC
jgi:hypothetical protein